MKYYLVIEDRRHYIGPFSRQELLHHLKENTGTTDIHEACIVLGVEIVQSADVLGLEEEYKKQ